MLVPPNKLASLTLAGFGLLLRLFSETFCFFIQYWQDDYLQWNATEYGGLTQIVLSPELVWLPDFGIENRFVIVTGQYIPENREFQKNKFSFFVKDMHC